MTDFVVAVGVADVRGEPTDDAECVTQALMNMPVYAGEVRGAWTAVKLIDYMGWMNVSDLAPPIEQGFCKVGAECRTPLPLVTVVTAPIAPVYAAPDGTETLAQVYSSTLLPPLDITDPAYIQVALPGERTGWLARTHAEVRPQKEPYPRQSSAAIATFARQFLSVPYLWGGTSAGGLDCSGFVQLCYRVGGYFIPRDADQQDGFLHQALTRPQLRTGDLIFFGSQQITHVALALNEHEYIHAEGQNYHRVLINSFRPNDSHYYPRLDQIVWSMKRVIA